jgi:hypothetical protein
LKISFSRAKMLVPDDVSCCADMQNKPDAEDVITEAKEALDAFATVLGSSFGPVGATKMIRDRGGRIMITKHGATILRSIDCLHPVAAYIRDTALRGLEERFGDGTTSFVVALRDAVEMIEELAPKRPSLQRRAWLTALAREFVEVSRSCDGDGGVLGSVVRSVDAELALMCDSDGGETEQRAAACKICDTALAGQFAPHVSSVISKLVSEAAVPLRSSTGIIAVSGLPAQASHTFEGVAIERPITGRHSCRGDLKGGVRIAVIACEFVGFQQLASPASVGESQPFSESHTYS